MHKPAVRAHSQVLELDSEDAGSNNARRRANTSAAPISSIQSLVHASNFVHQVKHASPGVTGLVAGVAPLSPERRRWSSAKAGGPAAASTRRRSSVFGR
eukprot:5646158-Prymnesium_polylepis.1